MPKGKKKMLQTVDAIADRLESSAARKKSEADAKAERDLATRKRKEREAAASSRVAIGQAPNLKGLDDLQVVKVQSPFNPTGAPVPVMKSLRDDPLGRMAKRRQIKPWHEAAGRHWQRLWEEAEIGGARAIDPTKDAVDGRRFVDPFAERQQRAILALNKIARWLGEDGDALVHDVLGRRMYLGQVAASRGISDRSGLAYVSHRFRECLETLARRLGHVPGPKRRRDEFDQWARFAENPELHRAIHRAKRAS